MSTQKRYCIALCGEVGMYPEIVRITVAIVDLFALCGDYEIAWEQSHGDCDATLVFCDGANPFTTLHNAAKMLRQLGHEGDADNLEGICKELLADGFCTPAIGGRRTPYDVIMQVLNMLLCQ